MKMTRGRTRIKMRRIRIGRMKSECRNQPTPRQASICVNVPAEDIDARGPTTCREGRAWGNRGGV